MKCKVDGCERDAMYKGVQLCQMHYFRNMRNGTTDLIRSRKYRQSNPAGYQKLYEPDHHLAGKDGYVYEHRMVVYDKYGSKLPDCDICGKPTYWETCHVDHKDCDVTNNSIENLRPVCNWCNTSRHRQPAYENKRSHAIEIDGITKTASEWSRTEGVFVSGTTIIRRIALGQSNRDAVYGDKKTHNGKNQK